MQTTPLRQCRHSLSLAEPHHKFTPRGGFLSGEEESRKEREGQGREVKGSEGREGRKAKRMKEEDANEARKEGR